MFYASMYLGMAFNLQSCYHFDHFTCADSTYVTYAVVEHVSLELILASILGQFCWGYNSRSIAKV